MNWAHYLLQVNIYLIVFYGFYKLLLDKETYFILNRLYLIAAGVLSLTIPFLKFDWFAQQPISEPLFVGVDQFNQLMTNMNVVSNVSDQLTTGDFVVLIYLAGVLFCSLRLIYQLVSIKRFLKNGTLGTAFSFFRKKHVDQALPQAQTINKHEEIHMNQLHSLDVLFFELLGIITWFNPVIYLYKNTAKNIHEYLADEEAAKFQGDKKEYALLLLSSAFGVPSNSLTNNFHKKSLIKKRIFMLHKERSRKTAILKYGLFVPLFGIMLLLSSATLRYNEKIIKITTDIPLDESLTLVKDLVKETGKLTYIKSAGNIKPATADDSNAIPGYGTEFASSEGQQEKVYDFVTVDNPPSFPGGMNEFYNYLRKSVKYPAAAAKANREGKVFLSYIVEKDGKLSDIQVIKKAGYGFDEEAVRVITESPAWIPGVIDHKKVRVKYNIPIAFNLKKSNTAVPKKPVIGAVKKVNDSNMTGTVNANEGTVKNFASISPKKVSSFRAVGNGLPLNTDPLYVIDGVKTDEATMKALDQKSIESINVIKDAKGVMTYGEEGKNGVILITTKSPKSSKYMDYVRPRVPVDKKQ
jgi:TonB family protein